MGTDPCLGTKSPDGLLSFTLLLASCPGWGQTPWLRVEGVRIWRPICVTKPRLGTDPLLDSPYCWKSRLGSWGQTLWCGDLAIWRSICVRHRDWDRPLSELRTPRLGTDPFCGLFAWGQTPTEPCDWDRPLSELWTPRLGTDPCCGLFAWGQTPTEFCGLLVNYLKQQVQSTARAGPFSPTPLSPSELTI